MPGDAYIDRINQLIANTGGVNRTVPAGGDPVAAALDILGGNVSNLEPKGVSSATSGDTFQTVARAAGTKSGAAFSVPDYNNDAAYAALVRTQAEVYTAENAMKESAVWAAANTYDFSQPDSFMTIANADGKQVRGHVLFYPIKAATWQTTGLTSGNWQALCDAYLQAYLTRYPTVTDWDVVNEIISGDTDGDGSGYITGTPHITAAGSGDAFLQYAFKRAAAYTNQRLFYCDSNIEYANDGYHNVKRANLIGALTRAKNAGCRIDGYSMQCHLRPDPYQQDYRLDRQLLRNFCKSLMALGLVINLTEIDVQYPPSAGWPSPNTSAEWDRRSAEYVYQVIDTVLEATAGTASFPSHVSTWGLSDSYTSWPANPVAQRPLPFSTSPTFAQKPMFPAILQALGGYAK